MPPTSNPPVSLPHICAPREELLSIYDQCARKQFVFISAPAGYGKTVSTLLWLKKTEQRFSWFFLDKYDNTFSLFYRSLCRTLLDLAEANDLSHLLSSPSFAASPVESALEFISQLHWGEGRYSLVLDDLQNITNKEILKSLPFVLKRLPAFVNVLILSRTDMPEEMQGLTLNDNTAFIGIRELSFTPEEIRSLYIDYGWFVSREKAKDIHAETDGWIIILNAMLSNGTQRLSAKSSAMTLEDYFERNIWAGFDENTKAFLLKTSVVDSFTVELCEMLTEDANSAETLNNLIGVNINLFRFGQEYRYHNLFLKFLRDQSEKSGIDQVGLYSLAARYYLESQQFFKAAFYSMRTDDPELKMKVVQMFFQSKNPALDHFLEMASVYSAKTIPPEAMNRSPILYMPNILAAFLNGETENTAVLFDRFYDLLPTLLQSNHPIVGSIAVRLLLDSRIKIAGLLGFMDEKNIKWGGEFPGQAAVVTVQMPMLHRSVRDFYEFLDDGVKESVRGVFSCFLSGDCDCFYNSIEGGLLMEQNKLNEALEKALAAYNEITEGTSATIRFGVCLGLAEIYSIKGDAGHSREVLDELREWIDDNEALYLLKNLTAYEARQKLQDGNLEAAGLWLDNYFVSDSALGEFYKIYQSFTTARAYIVLGRMQEAQAALERIKKLATDMDRPLDTAEAETLIAISEWDSGKKKSASARLRRVLAALLPYGFMRVIVNEGKAVLPILTAALKQIDKDPDRDENLYRFAKEAQLEAYGQSRRYSGLTYNRTVDNTKLSPKQTMILEYLSKGYKNAEIVEETGLSINTIREHTRVAYRKLEVTNAMDAVNKARQLGFLE